MMTIEVGDIVFHIRLRLFGVVKMTWDDSIAIECDRFGAHREDLIIMENLAA